MRIIQEEFFQSASQVYPCTETLENSTGNSTPDAISSPAATRVSRSVKPGSAEARRMTVTSGRKCIELLNKRDPLLSLLKTWLVTSRWDSTRCWLTWRAKATPLGRLYFQLAPKTPRIDVIDAGSSPEIWNTPIGSDAEKRGNPRIGAGLAGQVQLWPTPNTMDSLPARENIKEINNSRDGRKNRVALSNLREAVVDPDYQKMWPTPDTNNHRDGTKLRKDNNLADGGRHGVSLHHAVAANPHQLWPTPTTQGIEHPNAELTESGRRLSRDKKSSHSVNLADQARMLGNHPEVRNTGQGTLNPDWVELLMGYPAGWTCLDDGQTDLGKTERQE